MAISINNEKFVPTTNHYINSYVDMDDQGNISLRVDLTCTDKLVAFIGGVQMLYFDGNNKRIGSSDNKTLHCGPAPIIGAAHASQTWGEQAPTGTARIGLVQVSSDDYGPILRIFEILIIIIGKAFAASGGTTDQLPPGTSNGQVDNQPLPEPSDPAEQNALKNVKVKLTLSALGAPTTDPGHMNE